MPFGRMNHSSHENLNIENTRKPKSRGGVRMQSPRYMCVNLEYWEDLRDFPRMCDKFRSRDKNNYATQASERASRDRY